MSEKKKILIIDDEKSVCDVVKKGLELISDFDVSIATSGKAGIIAAKQIRPHLILLDIRMSRMDGIEVLKILKSDESTIGIPVVMLTAVLNGSTKEECNRLYDEMYIEKPVRITVLKTKIDEVIRRKWGEDDTLPILHGHKHPKTRHENKRFKIAIRFWAPVFLWAAAIFYLSSISPEYFPQVPIQHADKIVHFIEYAVFGWLLIRAFKHSRPRVGDVMLVAASVILITAFAMSDEWHQSFVHGRVGDFSDVVLDTISSGVGIFFYLTGGIRIKK
ncbi:MAG: VanZ family protein [Candidatus Omnitrophica bacterium]|nr:VanZ family protein [Candidatus Omnitrophota bacterium]